MVVSPEAHATRAGLETLRAGGTAVDGAVAVAFALAVTYPLAGNLGGGGFLLYRAADGTHQALDFRETAPRKLQAESFLDEDGRPVPGLSLRSGLAVGVPGSVAGLADAHRRWGTRPWPELLRPAIRLAEEGFEVYPWLALALRAESERLGANAEARRIFTDDGRPLTSGERLVQPELAATLRAVAERGAEGFYRGAVATAVARTVGDNGGLIDELDLEAYRPLLRRPLEGRYRGYRVISFPPPSSGGVALLQILGMLENFDLREAGAGSSLAIHLVAEAERRAFADRSRWLGDPAYVDVPLAQLLEPDYLSRRAAGIKRRRASRSQKVLPGRLPGSENGETLHYVVADSAGRAVSLTTTLNTWFGTGIVARGTGVLLNNEMDDFALAPGIPNAYGLLGSEANAVEGGKRPLSSMTPTLIESAAGGSRPVLILGSPGGATIVTSVVQVVINVIDHGMTLQEAVDAPRFHHQWQPDILQHEPRAFPSDVSRNLTSRGHRLEPTTRPLGNVNAIGVDVDGSWLGAADPRREGLAAGY
jgi:gamma-glutamyltranspeptidase/glutathione hydrolase